MPDAFDSSIFGPDQVPFRYARPDWLRTLEPEEGDLSSLWLRLVAHVANTTNESGFVGYTSDGWLFWPGHTLRRCREIAESLERAGALSRMDDRWYVVGWRDVYRVPDPA